MQDRARLLILTLVMNGAFVCVNCEYESRHFTRLIRHYRYVHETPNGRFRIVCGISGCHKTCLAVRSLLKHIKQKHANFYEEHVARKSEVQNVAIRASGDKPSLENESLEVSDGVCNQLGDVTQGQCNMVDVERKVALFLLKLRELFKVSGKACTFIASQMADILEITSEKYSSNIRANFRTLELETETCMPEIQAPNCYRELKDIFLHFNDNRRLNEYAQEQLCYVEPVEIILGQNAKGANATVQYVPILKTIETLLKHEDVLAEVMQGHQSLDGKIRDFCDAANYQNNEIFRSHLPTLEIQLYTDDFTIANPLGNKAKTLKLGAFYFILGNLSPQYKSKLYVIQLAIICKSIHIKKYGFSKVMEPLIQDLITLESDGVTVKVNTTTYNFKGTVSYMSADNLAAHGVGGFVESFSGFRISRFCMATSESIKTCLSVDSCEMRTQDSYNAQASLVSGDSSLSSVYGIKENSPLNKLNHYHVIGGLPSDISHDLFEGLVPEVLEHVIRYCVQNQIFTMEYLNDRIDNFPYGSVDKPNKPSVMPQTVSNFKVKQTAMQCWCLLRLFPLLVGEKVPANDEKWEVILKLMFMVEAVCSPVFSKADVLFLGDIVEDFLQTLYEEQFSEVGKIKPKGHYTLHYPYEILNFGPLVNCWTLRFEGKHNYFKEFGHMLKNRKNVCKSLAVRHQFMQSIYHANTNYLDAANIETFCGKLTSVALFLKEVQDLLIPLLGDQQKVYECSSIKVNGVVYSSGSCVIDNYCGNTPQFHKIEDCVIIGNVAYLVCQQLQTIEFNAHYHSYIVSEHGRYKLIKPIDLSDYHPLDIYICQKKFHIILRHKRCM